MSSFLPQGLPLIITLRRPSLGMTRRAAQRRAYTTRGKPSVLENHRQRENRLNLAILTFHEGLLYIIWPDIFFLAAHATPTAADSASLAWTGRVGATGRGREVCEAWSCAFRRLSTAFGAADGRLHSS